MPDLRLKGQEISVRVVDAGQVVDSIDSVSSFNEEVKLELKEDGFLGETANRFDETMNGFGGDFEFQVHNARWVAFQRTIIDKAQRRAPGRIFNVVRTDFYPNGDSVVYTYIDVHWTSMPTSIAAKGEFVKVKATFSCSERPEEINALP